MQLLGNSSEEGSSKGCGIFDVDFKKFSSEDFSLRVPQMGWNRVDLNAPHPVFNGLKNNRFYFVHSFRADSNCDGALGITNYGEDFASVYSKNNFLGVQFHPEKSHKYGMELFKNFVEWKIGSESNFDGDSQIQNLT